jgi:DMSO/TMAO reductase YedYZ molybdopterin-dependent catalytic subunit
VPGAPIRAAPVAPVEARVTPVEARVAPVEARAISRRRFIIQMGGLAATFVVVGAGVEEVLRAQVTHGTAGPDQPPVPLPNADAAVQPAPGGRPEYTPVADHFRVDINLTRPQIHEAAWRLTVDGLVASPLSLRLDQLRADYRRVDQFATLACISNPLGGPLIGTTLWTGVPLRDVLAQAGPRPDARYAHVYSADGFDEEIEMEVINIDPRILLVYAWDGEPLPTDHGFPLRLLIPDRYGMKQPKWITQITLTSESSPGYWVRRNWDAKAEVKTTSVIDTVATKELLTRAGRTYIPIGGIAYSGAKVISKVEIQIDDGPWAAAQLREPLSALTWVIWRFDWPFAEGTHWLAVRAYDGEGRLQETGETVSQIGTAVTGLYKEYRTIEPIEQ